MQKTTRLTKVIVKNYSPAELDLVETITWDDPDDDQLPISKDSTRSLVPIVDIETGSPTYGVITYPDVSGEDQMVQDIAGVLWV